jgi:hypothetical protein
MTFLLGNQLKVAKDGLKQEAPSQSEFDGLVRSAKHNPAEYPSHFDIAGQLEAAVDTLGPINPTT